MTDILEYVFAAVVGVEYSLLYFGTTSNNPLHRLY